MGAVEIFRSMESRLQIYRGYFGDGDRASFRDVESKPTKISALLPASWSV